MLIRKEIFYNVDEILKLIRTCKNTFVLNGDTMNSHSLRYYLFQSNTNCVVCGLGTKPTHKKYFAKERHDTNLNEKYHLNLYIYDEETEIEYLMTKDHIIPKSKGGKDDISNMQTMCICCNTKKGNKEISNEELRNIPNVINMQKQTYKLFEMFLNENNIKHKWHINKITNCII